MRWTSNVIAGLLVAGLLGSCAGPAPAAGVETAAELAAQAVSRACAEFDCDAERIYVQDRLQSMQTTPTEEIALPEPIRRAVARELGDLQFVDFEEAEELFGDDGLVDGGKGVLISVGPIEELAADVQRGHRHPVAAVGLLTWSIIGWSSTVSAASRWPRVDRPTSRRCGRRRHRAEPPPADAGFDPRVRGRRRPRCGPLRRP